MSVGNPEAPRYAGVRVDHPQIVEATKNAKKNGVPKEEAMKRIGMPMEVISRIYRDTK